MKVAKFVLALIALIGMAFGAWGTFTVTGRSHFDEMDGLYPVFAGIGGGLLIVVVIALQALTAFVAKKTTDTPSAKPRFSRYSLFLLLAVPIFMYALFEIFCDSTLGTGGTEVLSYWWGNSSYSIAILILTLVLAFTHSLLFVDFLKMFYAAHFGAERTYVHLGKNLDNGPYFYDFSDSLKRPIATIGDTYDQTKWFFDSLFDLKTETVIQYGHRPEDVLKTKAFGVSSAIASVFVQWALLFFLVLVALGVFGTYLEEVVPETETFHGESTFVTAVSWLWAEHNTAFMVVLSTLAALTALAFWGSTNNRKRLQKKFRSELVTPLPDKITPGHRLTGEIVDYAKESRSKGGSSRRRPTHYNLLIKFENIYAVPIWLRISLTASAANKKWMKRVEGPGTIRQKFVVQPDLSVWPDHLELEDLT